MSKQGVNLTKLLCQRCNPIENHILPTVKSFKKNNNNEKKIPGVSPTGTIIFNSEPLIQCFV